MKRYQLVLLIALAVGVLSLLPITAQAQPPHDVESDDVVLSAPGVEVPAGYVARYRVTYTRSRNTTSDRSATVVSITNQSLGACATSVDWLTDAGVRVCTTILPLGAGRKGEHCTRNLSGEVVSCNVSCAGLGLTNYEGMAIVGSINTTNCQNIAVSARTYYNKSSDDSEVEAITDAKVVKIGQGNSGD